MKQVAEFLGRLLLFLEYVLTCGLRPAFFLTVYTVALWVRLSEYYLASRFPWWEGWWERFFVVPAVIAPAVFAVYGVWRLEANRPKAAPLAFGSLPASVDMWIVMLGEAGRGEREWVVRGFLRWEARMLTRYGKSHPEVSLSRLSSVWRGKLRHLLGIAWFPALLAYLCSPLPTGVMELLATILSEKPPGVTNVVARCLDAKNKVTEETLIQRPGTNDFVFLSPRSFPQGWLTIDASDFPRVYRSVQAVCAGANPGCLVAGNAHTAPNIVALNPLRGGRTSFDFVRTPATLDLQMALTVFKRDGNTVVGEATVH